MTSELLLQRDCLFIIRGDFRQFLPFPDPLINKLTPLKGYDLQYRQRLSTHILPVPATQLDLL